MTRGLGDAVTKDHAQAEVMASLHGGERSCVTDGSHARDTHRSLSFHDVNCDGTELLSRFIVEETLSHILGESVKP